MKSISRKFLATLLIMWFPLFAGNVLAASITMQTMAGDCSESQMATDSHHVPDAGTMPHSMKPAGNCDHQHDPLAHKCGICSFSCAGHMTVSGSVEIAAIAFPSSSFETALVQFQSTTFVPLLPPPLARV